MANKDIRYLQGMLTYIEEIDGIINGRQVNEVLYEYGTDLSAILMKMMQIGELVSRMSFGTIDEYSEVVDWRSLKGLRNIIAHKYDKIQLDVIADTIKKDFPELKQQLTFILLTEKSKNKNY